jgi:hypothetical protein
MFDRMRISASDMKVALGRELRIRVALLSLATAAGACTGGAASEASSGARSRPLTTLAAGLNYPGHLAVAANSVYFTVNGTAAAAAALMKVPTGGGTPTTLGGAGDIAVDAASVYVTTGSTVEAIPLGGGTPVTLASGLVGAASIAVDAINAYWTDFLPGTGAVSKMPLAGGTPITLASGLDFPESIAVDATSVYWVKGGTDGKPSPDGDTTLMKMLLGGGTPTTLASAGRLASGSRIAVDGKNVYWTVSVYSSKNGTSVCTLGTVTVVPSGGGAATLLASGQNGPGAIVVDGTDIYWVNEGSTGNDGSVMKLPIAGGKAVTVASAQEQPADIAIDETYVYWTTEVADGAVMKTLKAGLDEVP